MGNDAWLTAAIILGSFIFQSKMLVEGLSFAGISLPSMPGMSSSYLNMANNMASSLGVGNLISSSGTVNTNAVLNMANSYASGSGVNVANAVNSAAAASNMASNLASSYGAASGSNLNSALQSQVDTASDLVNSYGLPGVVSSGSNSVSSGVNNLANSYSASAGAASSSIGSLASSGLSALTGGAGSLAVGLPSGSISLSGSASNPSVGVSANSNGLGGVYLGASSSGVSVNTGGLGSIANSVLGSGSSGLGSNAVSGLQNAVSGLQNSPYGSVAQSAHSSSGAFDTGTLLQMISANIPGLSSNLGQLINGAGEGLLTGSSAGAIGSGIMQQFSAGKPSAASLASSAGQFLSSSGLGSSVNAVLNADVPQLSAFLNNLASTGGINSFDTPGSSCGGSLCPGYGYTDAITRKTMCLASAKLSFCDYGADTWKSYVEQFLNYVPCHGDFNFTIATGKYWLRDTNLLRWNGAGWNVLDTTQAAYYTLYLARLKPGEGSGSFYCTTPCVNNLLPNSLSSDSTYADTGPCTTAYFYNGTYFSLATDSAGSLISQVQSIPQYASYMFPSFVTSNETGCNPVCIWLQMPDNITMSDGTVTTIAAELMLNGSFWYSYYFDGAYQLYTGALPPAISQYLNFFSNYSWKAPDGSLYKFINGSLCQMGKKGQLLSIAADFWNWTMSTGIDPLAKGGYYHFDVDPISLRQVLVYTNVTGDYLASIVRGVLTLKRKPPPCDWDIKAPRPQLPSVISSIPSAYLSTLASLDPACLLTPDDHFPLSKLTVCDPNSNSWICGDGYVCAKMPAAFNLSCTQGLCVPDFSKACSASTTSLPAAASTPATVSTTLQKYGGSCNFGSDCYTGVCIDNACSCTSCTKVLPGFDWSWRQNSLVYKETCIPTSGSVGVLGDVCNMWAGVGNRYCGWGLTCSKCPDKWSASAVSATCVALDLSSVSTTACPSDFHCYGYKATCSMIAGSPTCVCPAGYGLETNKKDCFGLTLADPGTCSVTCGFGIRQLKYVCDKSSSSAATCSGDTVKTQSCSAGVPCNLPTDVVKFAVNIKFQSEVLSPDTFGDASKSAVSGIIAGALNAICVNDSSTFENQCCPDKIWPGSSAAITPDCVDSSTGIQLLNMFSNNKDFNFYVTANGNPSSSCCSNAASKSGRTRRAASSTMIGQAIVANAVSSPTTVADLAQAAQDIDPNAQISQNSITVATTPAPSTNSAIVQSQSSSSDGGLAPWAIGVIAVACLLFVVGVVVAAIFIRKKMVMSNNKVETTNYYAGPVPVVSYDGESVPGPRMSVEARVASVRPSAYPRVNSSFAGTGEPGRIASAVPAQIPAPENGDNSVAYPPYYGSYPPPQSANVVFAATPAEN